MSIGAFILGIIADNAEQNSVQTTITTENPTITVLWKIAVGYKVSFTSLLEKKGEKVSVIKCAGITPPDRRRREIYQLPHFPF